MHNLQDPLADWAWLFTEPAPPLTPEEEAQIYQEMRAALEAVSLLLLLTPTGSGHPDPNRWYKG